MKQSVRKSMVGVVAATSVLALTTATAHATGQGLTTTQAITLTNSGNAVMKDLTTGVSMTCTSSKGTGTADVSNPPSNPVFRINSLTFTTPGNTSGECLGMSSLNYGHFTADTSTPWAFNVTGATDASGVTKGNLIGVKASIVDTSNCHATLAGPGGVGGTISGWFNNSSHSLTIGGVGSTSNLTVQSVDADCDPVLIDMGDAFSISITYPISPIFVINIPSSRGGTKKNLTQINLGR